MQLMPLPKKILACGNLKLNLSAPHVMGILNVTPDSFSDGGRHNSRELALAHARQMIADGLLGDIRIVNMQDRKSVV